MPISSIKIKSPVFTFGIPSLLLLTLVIILIAAPYVLELDFMSLAVTVDLILVIPFIYFLLIRKTDIPNITVVPVLILGLIAGSILLPQTHQDYLALFKIWGLPLVEVSVLSYIIYNVSVAVKRFRENQKPESDFYNTLITTCREMLPAKVVMPVVMEISVFYYGFINWKKRKLDPGEFSYHKDSGSVSLLIAIIFLVIVETVVLHILLIEWSPTAAWIISFISIYSGLQVFGFTKSLSQRPVLVSEAMIYARYGIMSETKILISDIESISESSEELDKNTGARKLSPLGSLEPHNIVIKLKKENQLTGLYGFRKNYSTLMLHIDKPSEFIDRVNSIVLQQD